ncbi:jg8955 [Pararge aegeria aegeria]|uniref:Jg8955 protein n=1 Tax=Pararge aegeria aegeria TaxID=348720 RepID=A0A8S4SDW1_9NEOP|nr:jg8955 [Pararge aegeria aegeria]
MGHVLQLSACLLRPLGVEGAVEQVQLALQVGAAGAFRICNQFNDICLSSSRGRSSCDKVPPGKYNRQAYFSLEVIAVFRSEGEKDYIKTQSQ